MAEVLAGNELKQAFRPSFFFWLSIVMTMFIFAGFGLTYWQPMVSGTLGPMPPVVHIHGMFYFCWMLFLVSQSFLINVKNVRLHRALGTFGIGLGTGIIIFGALITVLFLGAAGINNPEALGLSYLSVVAVLTFASLFCLAISNVRNLEKHKRLIIFATIVILPPGINRFYTVAFGLPSTPFFATYFTMDVLIAAIFINDWRTLGKVSTTSLFGAAVIIIPQILFSPIIASEWFYNLCTLIAGLAAYR